MSPVINLSFLFNFLILFNIKLINVIKNEIINLKLIFYVDHLNNELLFNITINKNKNILFSHKIIFDLIYIFYIVIRPS